MMDVGGLGGEDDRRRDKKDKVIGVKGQGLKVQQLK